MSLRLHCVEDRREAVRRRKARLQIRNVQRPLRCTSTAAGKLGPRMRAAKYARTVDAPFRAHTRAYVPIQRD